MHLTSTALVAGCSVAVCNTLKTHGIELHSALTFVSHINDIARAYNFHAPALHHIRGDVAITITCSIVGASINYCNSLLFHTNEGVLYNL